MTLLFAALLGIIQGLTEFLPISSSAHLILARAFFGWDLDRLGLAFDVALHVGTLAAILIYFRRELIAMLAGLPWLLSSRAGRSALLLRRIVLGTVPAVVVGLLFGDVVEQKLRTPGVAALALAVGALLLFTAERSGRRIRDEASISMSEALWLGAAQAAALIPGVSRSGATIAVGMLFGLRREAAARFGFLLGVPAILAAAGKEALDLQHQAMGAEGMRLFGVGVLTSAVVGYVTVKYFIRYLVAHSLDVFAYYRLVLAASVAIWLVLR